MTSFCDACKNGDMKQVLLMIEIPHLNTNDFNCGLYGACSGGHKEIALLMIEKGANDFNYGLYYTCYSGHKELALIMIEKGANDFDNVLYNACSNGHKELVLLMIENGADDFNGGLHYACENDHKEIALLMIENGADIDKCSIELNLEDIYYLYQKGVSSFGKYKDLYEQCKAIKELFLSISNEFVISNISEIIVSF